MSDIKLVYTNGNTKTLPKEKFGKTLKRIIKKLKNRNGLTFTRLKEGNLDKAYMDGDLVLDREKILEEYRGRFIDQMEDEKGICKGVCYYKDNKTGEAVIQYCMFDNGYKNEEERLKAFREYFKDILPKIEVTK